MLWSFGALMLAFDNVDLSPRSVIAPNVVVLFSRFRNLERQCKSSPIGLADILIISMCAYTNFLIAFNAAFSGLSRGRVAACASKDGHLVRVAVWGLMSVVAGTPAAVMAGVRVLAAVSAVVPAAILRVARKIEDQNGGQQKSQRELAGLFDSAKQFRVMVAGAGFEPTTFGL